AGHLVRLDGRVRSAVQSCQNFSADGRVQLGHLARVEQRELPSPCVIASDYLLENAQLGLVLDDRQRPVRPEADAGNLGCDLLPQLARAERELELLARPPATDPDQAEVPHRRAAGGELALDLDDLEAAPARLACVHAAEYAAADDDRAAHGGEASP